MYWMFFPLINTNDSLTCLKWGKYHNAAIINIKCTTNNWLDSIIHEILIPINLIKKKEITTPSKHWNELLLLKIKITNQDVKLINHIILSLILNTELLVILKDLKQFNKKELHFYTDSSMDLNCLNNEYITVIGAGWIIKNTKISFSCGCTIISSSILYWPDSSYLLLWQQYLSLPVDYIYISTQIIKQPSMESTRLIILV